MGVANSDAKLYDDEIQECIKRFPGQFRCDYALSLAADQPQGRQDVHPGQGGGVQGSDLPAPRRRARMYFCGLKGMMPGILEMLEGVCKEKGINYEEWLEGLKEKGQWHVEVY